MKKKIIQKILRSMARAVLKKRRPFVIAITGSIGKTTTKEMVGKMLSDFKEVRFSKGNYNNEIGVPLTIIGTYIKPGRSKLIQFFKVFFVWLSVIFSGKNYPEILILEFGADHPGDIKYLCEFIPVSVGVLTDIGISHLENFGSKDSIAKEKGVLLRSLSSDSLAVFNCDNPKVKAIGKKINANTLSYGFSDNCKLRASDFYYDYKNGNSEGIKVLNGTGFKLTYQGKLMPVKLDYCIGTGSVYAALAALGVGLYFDLNMVEMMQSLKNVRPCPGRMNLIKGIKETIIIDDSYNSAPDSLSSALEALRELNAERKILVLGDMLELGEEEEEAHKQALSEVFDSKPDAVLLVGERFQEATESLSASKKEKVIVFENAKKAGRFLQDYIKVGDLILIKGSRGISLEKAVKEIMRHPEEAKRLLV
ncbi:MAG: UDP-N-acetylmuramoyl-tripeptide--D-alanyl-D-alanine ligase [Candidatus Moraniibacteriota bacterium]